MKRVSLWASAVAFLFVAACEKDHATQVDSGDTALFAHVPAGQDVLWGGNYTKVQSVFENMGPLFDQMGSGGHIMSQWMTCFGKLSDLPKSKFVGGAHIADGGVTLTFAMSGFTVDDIAKCGNDAGLATKIDADHKFVAIDMPRMGTQPQLTLGYLVLSDGSLYSRESFKLGLAPSFTVPSRAELEADIAGLGGTSAASDPMLASLGGKVDRVKTVWFIATGAKTPLAGRLGEVYGTLDMKSGIAFDVTAQLLEKADADKAEEGVATIKGMAEQVPAEFKEVIKSIQLQRTGDHLHLHLALSAEQLEHLMSQLGTMIPGAGARMQ